MLKSIHFEEVAVLPGLQLFQKHPECGRNRAFKRVNIEGLLYVHVEYLQAVCEDVLLENMAMPCKNLLGEYRLLASA